MSNKYDHLTHEELVSLLVKRDASRKFGLVWERDEIEHENALNNDFVTVELDESNSSGDAPYKNLIIEGDNFDALRYLKTIYNGGIKCIYIDPPYNTGNKDFVYNDHYIDSDDTYRHSTWLEFLYRRLELAKDLLSESGVLLVSINDENRAALELLLDEILPGKRAGSFVWRSRQGDNRPKGAYLSVNHEHVLVYAMPEFRFIGAEKTFDMYSNPDNDPRGEWRTSDLTGPASSLERPNTYYPIYNPKTDIWYPCNPNNVWRFSTEKNVKDEQILRAKTIEQLIEEDRVIFPKDGKHMVWNSIEALKKAIENGDVPKSGSGSTLLRPDMEDLDFYVGKKIGWGIPAYKRYRSEIKETAQPLSSWIRPTSEKNYIEAQDHAEIVSGYTDEGSKLLRQIFDEKVFNFPKPLSLMQHLIEQATTGDDIVLDFFAGTGTTGHAVLQQNKEDGQKRRFILVSSTEANVSEPHKNICQDVTAERIRRVISGYAKTPGTGGNFAYMRTKRIPMEEVHVDIQHDQIWYTLQLLHSNAVSSYREEQPIHILEMEDSRMMYLESLSDSLIKQLREMISKDHKSTVIYTWQPQVIEEHLFSDHIHIEQIPEYILKRFGEQK